MLSEQLQFELLLDDAEWFLGNFTLDRPVENVIGDVFDVGWEFTCWDDLLDLREWGLVVGPVEDIPLQK